MGKSRFVEWLRKRAKTLMVLTLAGALIQIGLGAFNALGALNPQQWAWILQNAKYAPIATSALQAIILLLVYLLGFRSGFVPCERRYFPEKANKAVDQFTLFWKINWFFWILFYVFLTIENIHNTFHPLITQLWLILVIDFCNNANTLCLVMCFLVLWRKTVSERGERYHDYWIAGVLFLVIFTAIEVAILPHFQPNAKSVADIAGAVKVLPGAKDKLAPEFEKALDDADAAIKKLRAALRADDETQAKVQVLQAAIIGTRPTPVRAAFQWMIGGAAAVALALLIGRLDSKLFGTSVTIVVLGYVYAVIQVGYMGFDHVVAQMVLTLFALVLKVLLFLYVAWILDSGIMVYYMIHARKAIDTRENERNSFCDSIQTNDAAGLLAVLIAEECKVSLICAWEVYKNGEKVTAVDASMKKELLNWAANVTHNNYVLSELIVDPKTKLPIANMDEDCKLELWKQKVASWNWLDGRS